MQPSPSSPPHPAPPPPVAAEPDSRVWVEFTDPAEPAQRFRCDLTWLTSGYRCIFGSGCRGLSVDRPHDGCCGLGAHFCDSDDLARVAAAVAQLGAADWQFAPPQLPAPASSWTEPEDGETKTRVVDGACILLNREGFAGGAGCALHSYALRQGVSPVALKPDVCWQLPLHRDYRTVELPDESSYLEITIGEYDRGRWGPGGHDFDWYCTGSARAHGHSEPMFATHADELTELMGPAGYAQLRRLCEAHLEAVAALDAGPTRTLLPLFVHPATTAAREGRATAEDEGAVQMQDSTTDPTDPADPADPAPAGTHAHPAPGADPCTPAAELRERT